MKACIVAAAFIIGVSSSVFAQDSSSFDFSAGYSLLRLGEGEIAAAHHGWALEAAYRFDQNFGFTAEVGGNYRKLRMPGGDIKTRVHAFLVGGSFAFPTAAKVTPFAQVLLGAARPNVRTAQESAAVTQFVVQVGAGLDVWLAPRWGVRGRVDLREILTEGRDHQFRLYLGFVVRGD